jgi:hypothetical protein
VFLLGAEGRGLVINYDNEKPPAAVAGGGLVAALKLKLVGQA